MNKIVFASHNIHKVSEIQHSIEKWDIVSLKDLDYADDIPETGSTCVKMHCKKHSLYMTNLDIIALPMIQAWK